MIRTPMGRPPDEILLQTVQETGRSNLHLNRKAFRFRCAPTGPVLATRFAEARAMFHPDTQFLIDHWTALSRRAGTRGGIPDRAALEPDLLGLRLPRAFMARRTGEDAVVRLAGGWIEAFHGEPLKDLRFLSLWRTPSRPLVSSALVQTVREGRPVVIVSLAGQVSAQIEVTLMPLRGRTGQADQLLGLYAPAATLTMARDDPRLLTARVSIGVGDAARAPLSLAAVGGRRIA